VNGSELLAKQNLIAIVQEAFAIHLPFYLRCTIQGRFDRTKASDDVFGSFVANSWGTGDVVDGVAFQREQVRDLARLHAHECFHFGCVVPFVVLHRVEHEDAIVHQLQHVLIARNDNHLERLSGSLHAMAPITSSASKP
jgi:hypothetical protein